MRGEGKGEIKMERSNVYSVLENKINVLFFPSFRLIFQFLLFGSLHFTTSIISVFRRSLLHSLSSALTNWRLLLHNTVKRKHNLTCSKSNSTCSYGFWASKIENGAFQADKIDFDLETGWNVAPSLNLSVIFTWMRNSLFCLLPMWPVFIDYLQNSRSCSLIKCSTICGFSWMVLVLLLFMSPSSCFNWTNEENKMFICIRKIVNFFHIPSVWNWLVGVFSLHIIIRCIIMVLEQIKLLIHTYTAIRVAHFCALFQLEYNSNLNWIHFCLKLAMHGGTHEPIV